MSSKRTLDFSGLIVDGDMSSTVTGPSTNILHMDRVGLQLKWTGTPTGTFSVQISNDNTNWIAMDLSSAVSATGSADDAFIDVESAAKYVRLVYTATSGSGTLNVHITSKSISG